MTQYHPDTSPEFALFLKQVRDVLENLYDFAHLQRHPFAETLAHVHARPGETAGQCLRRVVLTAIQSLDPGGSITLRDAQARAYNVLHLRYVEGMTIQEAGIELGISERQAYRHLISARESLALILWRQYPALHSDNPAPAATLTYESDLQHVDIRELLEHAVKSVERLAEQRDVTLQIVMPATPVLLRTLRPLAKQVMISIISRAVQQSPHTELRLTLRDTSLHIAFAASVATDSPLIDSMTGTLVAQLGWQIMREETALTLRLLAQDESLLVIDDDSGLGELVERYLTNTTFKVLVAASGAEGLRMAQDIAPDLIILDVMMPHMDGWEVLQRLKANERTRSIPIIVCSIFNDPELAYSLGATAVLAKPLAQADLLDALEEISHYDH